MATVTHVLSGAGEPLDPPPSIGAHYVNTNNGALYLAKGTASGADWVKLGSGGGSAPSEVLHVNTDGQFLLEPQHSFVEARPLVDETGATLVDDAGNNLMIMENN